MKDARGQEMFLWWFQRRYYDWHRSYMFRLTGGTKAVAHQLLIGSDLHRIKKKESVLAKQFCSTSDVFKEDVFRDSNILPLLNCVQRAENQWNELLLEESYPLQELTDVLYRLYGDAWTIQDRKEKRRRCYAVWGFFFFFFPTSPWKHHPTLICEKDELDMEFSSQLGFF